MPSSLHKSPTRVSGFPIAAIAKSNLAIVILKGLPPFLHLALAGASPAPGTFRYQLPLKLSQCRKNTKNQFSRSGSGIKGSSMTR